MQPCPVGQDGDYGPVHVNQLGLISGRRQHEAGQAAQVSDVVRAGMGLAVGADQKLEIILLVERSHLPVRRTLDKLGIPKTTLYR